MTSHHDEFCPECGCVLPRQGRPRSNVAHRMLFGVIGEAFKQWPEAHPFQPEDSEHLRAYLFMHARHVDKQDIKCKHSDAIALEHQLRALIRANSGGKAPLLHVYPWGIRQFIPRSIAGHPKSQLFHAVAGKCYEVIEATIGVPVEKLRKSMRQAA